MKIIIAGGGEVGFHLAKLLSFESLDITLIDTEKERLNYAESHLDIKGIKGDASSIALMQEAQVENSDLFIAVTALFVGVSILFITKAPMEIGANMST